MATKKGMDWSGVGIVAVAIVVIGVILFSQGSIPGLVGGAL